MRLPYQVYADLDGNLQVMDGLVIGLRSGAIFYTGAGGFFSHDAPPATYDEHTPVTAAGGALFTGGSGRNLVCAGGLVSGLTGASFFRPEVTDNYRDGAFLLVVTGASAATISDATNVVAILSTGGTAPVGSYVLTTYGEDTYNGGDPATLAITAEEGGPGAIPNASVTVSAGSAQGGEFTAVDASNFESAADPNWTIVLQSDGEGRMKYLTDIVAVRAVGTAFDPSGRYEALEDFYIYNPIDPIDGELDDLPDVNPFGVLTLVFSWPSVPDLDIGVTFLGDTAGYGHSTPSTGGPVGDYMNWTGDDTGAAGSETVVIDLAAAWDVGDIETFADVLAAVDWFPSAGGHGPATLEITYDLGAGPTTLYNGPIYPGSTATPAVTRVKTIRILADGTMEAEGGPWAADVRRVAQPTRAGYVYLKLTETLGVLTAVEGPFLATDFPANSAGVFHFPIAISDGVGGIQQLHTGAIQWQELATTTGLLWISLTQADYDALTTPDPDTIYDITDAPWSS